MRKLIKDGSQVFLLRSHFSGGLFSKTREPWRGKQV